MIRRSFVYYYFWSKCSVFILSTSPFKIYPTAMKIFMNRTEDKINRYLAQSQRAHRESRSTTDIVWATQMDHS